MERIAENVANAVIDIAKILLAASGSPAPETYREILGETAAAGLADSVQAEELEQLARLRNALAHRYLDYKWESLRWFIGSGREIVAAWLARAQQIAG